MKKVHRNRVYALAFSTDKRKSNILSQIQQIDKKLTKRPRIHQTDPLATFEENVKNQIESYKASRSICK